MYLVHILSFVSLKLLCNELVKHSPCLFWSSLFTTALCHPVSVQQKLQACHVDSIDKKQKSCFGSFPILVEHHAVQSIHKPFIVKFSARIPHQQRSVSPKFYPVMYFLFCSLYSKRVWLQNVAPQETYTLHPTCGQNEPRSHY